jgi:hypothetical protein
MCSAAIKPKPLSAGGKDQQTDIPGRLSGAQLRTFIQVSGRLDYALPLFERRLELATS